MSGLLPKPLTWISGNLVYARDLNDAWAIFRVPVQSHAERSSNERTSNFHLDKELAREARADFTVLRLHRPWNAPQYARDLDGRRAEDLDAAAVERRRRYLLASARELSELPLYEPMCFVAFSLRDARGHLGEEASEFLEAPGEQLAAWRQRAGELALGRGDVLDPERLEADHDAADALFGRVYPMLPDARPATPREIEFLIRRAFARGCRPPELNDEELAAVMIHRGARRQLRIDRHDLLSFVSPVQIGRRELRVDLEEETGWQVGLAATKLPGVAHAPDALLELFLSPGDELGFPVDLALNVRWISAARAERDAEKRITQVDDQADEEFDSPRGLSQETDEATYVARSASSYIKDGQPLLHTQLTAIVYSENGHRAEAIERAREFKRVMRRYDCRFEIAVHQQLEVFLNHLPAQRGWLKGYDRRLTPSQYGALAVRGARVVGDTRGWMLGYALGSNAPVRLALDEGTVIQTATGVLTIGDLGSGKTTLMSRTLVEGFLDGARIIDMTHKRDDHVWHRHPDIAPYAREIDLTADSRRWRGLADTWISAPANLRVDAARDFLMALLPEHPPAEWQTALNQALLVVDGLGDRACNVEVLRVLKELNTPEARKVYEHLEGSATTGISQLGFADRASGQVASTGDEQVTVICADGLPLPSGGQARPSERVGEALIVGLTLMSMGQMERYPDRLKLFNYDEAAAILGSAMGRELLKAMQTKGRSQVVTPIIGLQLGSMAADPSKLHNLFGAYVILAQPSPEEAAISLRLAGLEPTTRQIRWLTEFAAAGANPNPQHKGRCLVVDHRRRPEFCKVVVPRAVLDITAKRNDDYALAHA